MAKKTSPAISTGTGIFIAIPNGITPKPIYANKKTKNFVNNSNCKLGGTKSGFAKTEKYYRKEFDPKVCFYPIAILTPKDIAPAKKLIIDEIKKLGIKSIGTTRDWFPCDKGICIVDIIINTLKTNKIPHTDVSTGVRSAICSDASGKDNYSENNE
jgi:hypothetical protein